MSNVICFVTYKYLHHTALDKRRREREQKRERQQKNDAIVQYFRLKSKR